ELKLLKILLKELERVLGRNTFAERVNKLTEDEPKLNGLAGNLDKKMNQELYSEQEQQQEQQKNQKRDRDMHIKKMQLCRDNLLVGMGYVLANLLASWLDLNWD